MRSKDNAFTLIELLIVVAIIGILAAIAIPNFRNAQIRAKVTQAYEDMKSLENPILLYKLDHNIYPYSQFLFFEKITTRYPIALTSPTAYIVSVPQDVFANYALEIECYPQIYVAKEFIYNIDDMSYSYARFGPAYTFSETNRTIVIDNTWGGIEDWLSRPDPRTDVHWRLESAGPDNIRWRSRNSMWIPFSEPMYDPSNGLVSDGNIYFTDKGGGSAVHKFMAQQ